MDATNRSSIGILPTAHEGISDVPSDPWASTRCLNNKIQMFLMRSVELASVRFPGVVRYPIEATKVGPEASEH